jgi:hypothetical protein
LRILSFISYLIFYAGTFLVIPYLSYQNGNWWLLIGSLVSLSGMIASPSIVGLYACLCIGVWIGQGFSFYQYVTFFFFCLLWGSITSHIGYAYYLKGQEAA